MAKAINKRQNHAKAMVHGDQPANFNAGKAMALGKQHPTDTNKKPAHHTTDDGARA